MIDVGPMIDVRHNPAFISFANLKFRFVSVNPFQHSLSVLRADIQSIKVVDSKTKLNNRQLIPLREKGRSRRD